MVRSPEIVPMQIQTVRVICQSSPQTILTMDYTQAAFDALAPTVYFSQSAKDVVIRQRTSMANLDVAGVAHAKIKAVYPHKTKEDIVNSSIPSMLREVSNILGSSRYVKENDSLIFYKKLQGYVDSKEKATGKKDKNGRKEKKEREYWPLIRVVRFYVRAQALSTGAVIVDLPGVHDANAARAAIAEK